MSRFEERSFDHAESSAWLLGWERVDEERKERYASLRMAPRWRTLIAVGFAVFALDQWTKLLVVKHLTPAFVMAYRAEQRKDMVRLVRPEEEDEVLGRTGTFDQLRYFLRASKPCADQPSSCPRVRVFESFWDWHYEENPGAAWSIFARTNERYRVVFLCSVSILALGFIVAFVRKLPDSQRHTILALSLVAGGALGNLVDRLRLGYVVDFISWYVGSYHWPTFNVADSAISSGVALLALGMLRDLKPKQRPQNEVGAVT
jgi:signal peptidase II